MCRSPAIAVHLRDRLLRAAGTVGGVTLASCSPQSNDVADAVFVIALAVIVSPLFWIVIALSVIALLAPPRSSQWWLVIAGIACVTSIAATKLVAMRFGATHEGMTVWVEQCIWPVATIGAQVGSIILLQRYPGITRFRYAFAALVIGLAVGTLGFIGIFLLECARGNCL
jgi:NO-binding membrane sensor protein with MHYT domain